MATYGPGIDQSQHTKSISHIIRNNIKVLRGGGGGVWEKIYPNFTNIHFQMFITDTALKFCSNQLRKHCIIASYRRNPCQGRRV